MQNKSHIIVRIILVVGVSIAIISLVIMLLMTPPSKIKANKTQEIGISNQNFNLGGDFILTNSNGESVDSKNLRGKLLLIYFGFSFCPDICPASLLEMTNALDALGDKEGEIVPIFITIDPERDSPKKLKEYFSDFDNRIMALSGTKKEIDSVVEKFHVYYSKSLDGKENTPNYLVNHSSFFYLIGKDGKLIKYYTPGVRGKDMGIDIANYIE